MNGKMLDLDFDLELTEFDFDVEIEGFELIQAHQSVRLDTALANISRYPRHTPHMVKYERAVDMVRSLPLPEDGHVVHAIVSGNFIFGDLLEAMIVEKDFLVDELLIATLSLSKDNVDSLHNLQNGGYVDYMGLVVSDYWYSHERRKNGGVPYIESTLCQAKEKFDLAAAGIHTKVSLVKTRCGNAFVFHGSANLRSSRNVEQFALENSATAYNFHAEWIKKILHHFRATNKSLRGDKLWQILPEQQKREI